MKWKNALGSLALAASALSMGACMVTARGHVAAPVAVVEVDEEPPPPRYETIEVRPGFVFISGRWVSNGGRWVWRDGYYERERVGYRWEQGRWENRGRRHVWVEGGWRGGGGPAVRDHREDRREERREERHDGPVVRDHR
jgi:hypothetical protein